MKTIFFSIAVFFTATLFAQTTSDTRTVSDFTQLNVAAPIKVEITQGTENSVVITGDAAEVKKIETEVKDGVLTIRGNASDEVVAKITMKSITGLEMSGACIISSINDIKTDTLTVTGSGASQAKLSVQTKKINATLSGASQLRLSGNTDAVNATLSSASSLKAYELMAGDVKVVTSSASSAHVHANNSLDASASGSSNIHYEGAATTKTINASGSGSVSMRGDNNNNSDTTSFTIGGYDVHLTPNGDDERSDREHH
ncbi:MAG TPA: head GIN domain-containing protein, partial [Bacteroidia bacterium]|nr:head GIN domain-containing protein [Bacteroidia bacterium]